MSDDNMVERVAKLIGPAGWDSIEDKAKLAWRCAARAVIATMREPTEAMRSSTCVQADVADRVWLQMIDAAIDERGDK